MAIVTKLSQEKSKSSREWEPVPYQYKKKQTVWHNDGHICPCFELSEECTKGGNHVWRTDGQHSNTFCRKCFKSKSEKT